MSWHPQDLLKLLHGQFSSLSITYNDDHAPNYMSAKQAIEESDFFSRVDWVSEDEKNKAAEQNSVWIIQWYPETPVGFCCVGASTFDAAARHALKESGVIEDD